MGQPRPLFRIFLSFSHSNINQNVNNTKWKNVDGVLGMRTRGYKMVGADKTTKYVVEFLSGYFTYRLYKGLHMYPYKNTDTDMQTHTQYYTLHGVYVFHLRMYENVSV